MKESFSILVFIVLILSIWNEIIIIVRHSLIVTSDSYSVRIVSASLYICHIEIVAVDNVQSKGSFMFALNIIIHLEKQISDVSLGITNRSTNDILSYSIHELVYNFIISSCRTHISSTKSHSAILFLEIQNSTCSSIMVLEK